MDNKTLFVQLCKEKEIPLHFDLNGVMFGRFVAEDVFALFEAAFEAGRARRLAI
jgi:hypothetical protein